MPRTKLASSSSAPAVRVSQNLQLAVLTFSTAGVVVSALSYWLSITAYGASPAVSYIAMVMLQIFYPVLVAVAAFVMTKPHRNFVNRAFIAVVKTVVVYAILGIVQSIYSQASIMTMRSNPGTPPSWITSNWPMIIMMIATLLGYIGFQYYRDNKKK